MRWAQPFLSVAAFLSVIVPAMLYQNYAVLTAVLIGISILYVVMAVRLQLSWLVLAAIAAVNFAIVSGALLVYRFEIDLARVVAFAFCAWAVILFFARRGVQYVRLNEWAKPFELGALANFGLTYAIVLFIALDDLYRIGFLSQTFALTLLGGVGLLALTAYLYRRAELVYAATWLLIAPTYIFAALYLVDATRVGLALGVLMLLYVAIGFLIGRARLKWSGAFLSAAASLSVIVVTVLYPNYAALTVMLLGIALLYALNAVWLRWRWLTLAALGALNLAVITAVLSTFVLNPDIQRASAIGYSALGVVLLVGAVGLKRRGFLKWREPLYLVAAFDLLIAYALAFANSDALFVAVSAVVAVACFAMQWVERDALNQMKLPPALSYIGAFVTLNGIYFATRAMNLQMEFAPVVIALGCTLFVIGALVIRGARVAGGDVPAERLYGTPLRDVGLLGMVCMLILATVLNNPFVGALTFVLAAYTFGADGFMRKQIALVYAGGACIVATIWWALRFFNVTEWQAFVIPLGVLCLVIGWSEARRGRMIWFQVATVAGLLVLLVSAFYQSLSNVNYALLLLVEGVAAFGVGVKMRSRIYVEAGILALAANGLAQFGPAFIRLERWIQIGTIGSVLLLGGLVALFRRQRLLEVRRALTSEWKMWRP